MMDVFKVKTKMICILSLFVCIGQTACKKLIEVNQPINTITSAEVFGTDALAMSAMAGVYSVMINGTAPTQATQGAYSEFSAGLTTTVAGMSSDELSFSFGPIVASNYEYNTNKLSAATSIISPVIWTSAYTTIYKANSVIEGISASKSAALHDTVKNELTAEAKFIRAFSYFYLTNFFGDVPMVLTIDFNQTVNLPRMPEQQVYQQIISDLKSAQAALPSDYSIGKGERIVPNKWAATLMLARVYLYTGDYVNAALQASAVINNNSLYNLEPDLNSVFLTTSREAIWQLKQATTDAALKNATPEGYTLIANPLSTGLAPYGLTSQLLSAFEPGDKRRTAWVDSTDNSEGLQSLGIVYYPFKYKIGSGNGDATLQPSEYYMVLRLAEAYLIRAESEANGSAGGAAAAITDLNVIRTRAGLPNLANSLTQQQITAAVARERQVEFFAEWGHRWFDLKRTGQAHAVLSAIPLKQPWLGDYQLLYPIPQQEIISDHFLTQNKGY